MLKYILNYLLLNVLSDLIPHPKMRAVYLRLLGADIGRNVRIEKVTFIQIQNSIKNLVCRDNTFIGSNVILDLSAPIILEEFAAIAPGCTILTHQDLGEFNGNILCTIYKSKREPVHLEKNAVVGVDSTLIAGVNIRRNSVIRAKSLVMSDVPPNVLVTGVPASVVGKHGCLLPLEENPS